MKKNIIQIKGVKKVYKDVEVLGGVDLEVEQCIAIIVVAYIFAMRIYKKL